MSLRNTFIEDSQTLVKGLLIETRLAVAALTDQEKQIVATYSFGLINAYAMENKIEEAFLIQEATLSVLSNVFCYTDGEAREFFQFLIECITYDRHPAMYSIIHKGIDGYYDLQSGSIEKVNSDLKEIFDVIKNQEQREEH